MIFKCKICGGELNIERGQSIVECEYCGVKQTLPRFFDENVKLMYDRANNYLLHNEFDKAESIYSQILYSDKADADAYWSLLLCKYGVTYVKDPKTGKYIPTCNRTYYSSIFDDENYKNAIKYANEEKKALFEADAKTIDDIQHSIIEISRKEKPFDIFISYKETGANGDRTKDSIVSQDLYEKLTNEGYKVFFSRITLEDKIGTEYEPYIYAALASSKVMITICSSKENIEAVWVKNEWSRFLAFAQKDSTKTILPLYFDMDNTDLPDEFAHLPSYDMKKDGFEQDLLRGIKKLIPLPIMEKERRKKRKKLLKKIGIGAGACLAVAAICMIPWFMKLSDYNVAMQLYYDKNYPEATWAFDELGSYRNSKDMKNKCELSWRKSLSTIAISDYQERESYYITPNGTIDTFDYAPGTDYENYDINEHGKIISVEMQKTVLVALYEDGYVSVVSNFYSGDYKDLNNIIKVSPHFLGCSFALKNDGSMIVIKNKSDDWYEANISDKLSSWKDIVDFDCSHPYFTSGGNTNGVVIAGITKDKNLNIIKYDNYAWDKGEEAVYSYNKIIDQKFKNIKKVDVGLNFEIYLIALTYDGKILSYINGKFDSVDADDVVDISLGGDSYYELHSDGNLYEGGSNICILSDVVYIEDGFAVTRAGSIYRIYDYVNTVEKTEGKTNVLNEWLERMN